MLDAGESCGPQTLAARRLRVEVCPEVVDRPLVRGRGVPSSVKSKRAAGVGAPARKDTPMWKIVAGESTGEELASILDEICREGARRMLAAALEVEAEEYLAGLQA